MSAQLIPAMIMFFITAGVAALFWLPAIKIVQRCTLVNFYWMGFWGFLGGIAALSGAQSVLVILGQDIERVANALLMGLSAAFVVFVMFGWGRLSLYGATRVLQKIK